MLKRYPIPQPKKPQMSPHAPCDHQFERRMMTTSNGTQIVKDQCLKCWQVGRAYKRTECTAEQLRTMKPFDNERRDAMWKNRDVAWKNTESAHSELWWRWYDGYLKSAVWIERRAQVLKRANGKCEACGVAAAEHVHHLTYDHVGREPLFDLVAICHPCHDSVHEDQ